MERQHRAKSKLHPSGARECIEIDWIEDKLRRKLQAIAEVIRAVRPRLEEVILPELENPGIARSSAHAAGATIILKPRPG